MQSIFLGWLKKFGPAQNVLGPVKGQGISLSSSLRSRLQLDIVNKSKFPIANYF